jgi:chromosomal replication initiation ATPase DnaA
MSAHASATEARQLAWEFPLPERFSAEDWLETPSNHEATRWIHHWPEWKGRALFLAGPAASGKTHLAHIWRTLLPVPAPRVTEVEDFLALAPYFTRPDMPFLVIDGLERWAEHSDWRAVCQELFHLLNRLTTAESCALLITGTDAPSRMAWPFADIASRMNALPVASLHPVDEGGLEAMIFKYFHDRQLRVGADVIRFLSRHAERSYESLRRVVARVDREAMERRKPVTVPLVREVLQRVQLFEAAE